MEEQKQGQLDADMEEVEGNKDNWQPQDEV